ncbi:MAG TPA: cytochrome P450 [Acidimicrobiales bacterium]|nr:cytochrome P450 [Acidimicrobiales bacterium]
MAQRVDPGPAEVDLTASALYADGFPHDVFTGLRRDEPVRWQPFPEGFPGRHDPGFWVLSRHEDVQMVSRNPELFSAFDGPQLSHQPEIAGTMLVSMDGADHVRQRRLVSAGFTPRVVRQLDHRIRSWAESVVDRALEQGECDFVSEVAYKLPMHVIADIVGIPLGDRDWLFTLTNEFLQSGLPEDPIPPEEYLGTQVEMFEYAQRLGQDKRANPQDDVWTLLSTVEVETEDGGRTALSQIELDLFFILLTVAGSETTRNAVSQGLVALLDHPGELDALRADPGGLAPAVEEILRWSSPVAYFARRATRDTEIRGTAVAEGDRVTMWFPSANRDEDVFEDPFRFDTTRSPNPHLAFGGGGVHFCLGAHLARRELATLLQVLLERAGRIELAGEPRYAPLGIFNPILLFMQELPVLVRA